MTGSLKCSFCNRDDIRVLHNTTQGEACMHCIFEFGLELIDYKLITERRKKR